MKKLVAVVWMCLSPALASAADTLVVSGGNGTYKPGLAKTWTADKDAVTFELAAGVDAQKTATTLKERLAQATITVEGEKLTIKGIPAPALLDQLSALSMSGEGDPLAALAGLGGGGGAQESQEGGGSIRASKPTPLAMLAPPDAAAMYEAEVLDVTRATFPSVTLTVRLRKVAKTPTVKSKLSYGKTLAAPVQLSADLKDPATQQNLGAYYLKKGDRVSVRLQEPRDGEFVVDWIERK